MKNMQEEIDKPRKVALYKSLEGSWCMVDEVRFSRLDENYRTLPNEEQREIVSKGYVRITDPVDLSFRPLSDDDVIQKAVEALDFAEREAIRELNQKIAEIREQKSQLLALTHQAEEA